MTQSLKSLFESISDLKVLVIGDVMLDKYIHGKVERISPEAPVPVVDVTHKETRIGGAGNVAINVLGCGAIPIPCFTIGDDSDGDLLIELFENAGISTSGIVQSKKRSTTVKNRVVSGGNQLLRFDDEVKDALSEEDTERFKKIAEELISTVNLVIIEDYDKGALNDEVIRWVTQKCLDQNVPYTVDPKKKNFLSYKDSLLFKPNLKELEEGLNFNGKLTLDEIQSHIETLQTQLLFENCIVTLSEKGVFYFGQEVGHHAAHLRKIADVSGAGDTVITVASLFLGLGVPLKIAAELANLAGGIVCEESGIVPISIPRLLKESDQNEIVRSHFKEG